MVGMPNTNAGRVTAVFGPSGNLQLAPTAHPTPFLQRAAINRTIKIVDTQKPSAALGAAGAGGLSAPVASSAALALGGSRANASRPPSRQARQARKAPQQLLPFGSASKGGATAGTGNAADSPRAPRPALAGALLQLAARAFAAVGLIMQRVAFDDDELSMLRRVGLAAYMATAVPDMLSYLMAPHALISVLSSVEPLTVSVLAALLLPRDAAILTSHHSMATALCVAGILGCALSGPGGASLLGGAIAAPGVQDAAGLRRPLAGLLPPAGAWDAQGAERLLQPPGSRRFMMYLLVAIPVLCYLMRQAHKRKMNFCSSSSSCSFGLPMVAAMSLALQRLALDLMGVHLHAVHWQPWLILRSPTILATFGLVVVCMLCCAYHVCQGMLEAPPHIFVPTYCTMAALLRLFQSMTILREFRDEPLEKVLITLGCGAVSLLGVLCLHTARANKRASKGGFAGPLGRHDPFHCLEPVALAPVPALAGHS